MKNVILDSGTTRKQISSYPKVEQTQRRKKLTTDKHSPKVGRHYDPNDQSYEYRQLTTIKKKVNLDPNVLLRQMDEADHSQTEIDAPLQTNYAKLQKHLQKLINKQEPDKPFESMLDFLLE